MKRRDVIRAIAGSAAAWPFAALGQQAPKHFRIGITTIQQRTSPPYVAFDQRLRELGYIDGQNLTVEFVNPNLRADGISGSINELVRRKVDLIIAPYESAVKAALETTDAVPVVMIAIDYDPLALGFIEKSGPADQKCHGLIPATNRTCQEARSNPEGCASRHASGDHVLGSLLGGSMEGHERGRRIVRIAARWRRAQ